MGGNGTFPEKYGTFCTLNTCLCLRTSLERSLSGFRKNRIPFVKPGFWENEGEMEHSQKNMEHFALETLDYV